MNDLHEVMPQSIIFIKRYRDRYVLLALIPLIIAFIFLNRHFGKTNIEVQRLEANAR